MVFDTLKALQAIGRGNAPVTRSPKNLALKGQKEGRNGNAIRFRLKRVLGEIVEPTLD